MNFPLFSFNFPTLTSIKFLFYETTVLLLIPAFTITGYSQSKQELSLNLKKGETYRISQVIDQDIVQTIMGNSMEIKSHLDGSSSFYVSDADSSGYLLDIWYTELKMQISSPFLNIDIDSVKLTSEGNHLAMLFNKMKGMKYSARIDRNGEILEFSGLESAVYEIISEMDAPETNKVQMKEQIKQVFGDKTLKSHIVALVSFYPDKMVSTIDTWHHEKKFASFIPMIADNTWK